MYLINILLSILIGSIILFLVHHVVCISAIHSNFQIKPSKLNSIEEGEIPDIEILQDFFREIVKEAKNFGFELIGYLYEFQESPSTGTQTSYIVALHNPKEAILLTAIMASNKMEGVIRENWKKVIVLSCFLSDSHVIETTNSSENPFPIHWGQTYQTALKFPNENRLGVLLQKHRQFCHSGELNRQAKRVSLTQVKKKLIIDQGTDGLTTKDIAQLIYNLTLMEYQHFRRLGYFRQEGEHAPVFWTTWKGAIILTLRMMSPWKGIVNNQCQRYYKKLWLEISQ